MAVKNKLKLFMIFLILFISIASVSANEDLSDSSSLAIADNDDVDLIESVNVDDFDSGSDSVLCEDVSSDSLVSEDVSSNLVSSEDVGLESDSVVSEVVGSDSLASGDNDDVESSLSSSNLNSNNLGDSGKTFEDIQSLIYNANDGDTILLNGTYVSTGDYIYVGRPLTIDGQGVTTLNAKGLSSTFSIHTNNFVLRNLKICNSHGDDEITNSFGAVKISGRNNLIENCTFVDNHGNYGGAVFGNCSIVNSTFIRNNAGGGGAVYGHCSIKNSIFNHNGAGWGGAVFGDGSFLNSTFINNEALDYSGGAIDLSPGTSSAFVNCTFKNNSAIYGGAISAYTSSSRINLRINNCLFISNKALSKGGAVYQNKGNCLITNSKFTKNQVSNYDATLRTLYDYLGPSKGGAVSYDENSTGRINNCIFKQNTARFDGGAIDWNLKSRNITNCKFINNKSPRENDVCGLYTLRVAKSGVYAGNVVLTMTLYNAFTKKRAKNAEINLTFIDSRGKRTLKSVTTNAKGIARYYAAFPAGRHSVRFKAKWDLSNKVAINVKNFRGKLYANKFTTTFKSGKTYNVRMVNTLTKQRPTNVRLALRVYTGKKVQTIYGYTRNGVARFDISSVSAGTHKVVLLSALSSAKARRVNSQLIIKRGVFTVSAPKVTNRLYIPQSFNVTVLNKNTKKPAKNLDVRMRVYTGNEYKTYTRKTNSKGIASLTTKSFTKGTHRVIVSSGDRSCAFNVRSYIVIVE